MHIAATSSRFASGSDGFAEASIAPGLWREATTSETGGAKVSFWRLWRSTRWFALALVVAAVLLRLIGSARVPLTPEEAYYWMYAQHPALSYFDHPPMVAWCIALGTRVFGDTEFGVRFVAGVLMFGSSLLLYTFAKPWFGFRSAVLSAFSLQVLPVFFGMGFVATMDSALLFFWLVTLNGVSLALRHRTWGWYLAGFGLGCALLSKYTGFFLAPGVLLAIFLHRPWRRHFRSPHLYLALVLAVAIFSPVLLWNAQHDFASFRFQFVTRFQHRTFVPATLGRFVIFQLALLTPIPLIHLPSYVGRLVRGYAVNSFRTPLTERFLPARHALALAFSVPLLVVMTYKSFRSEIHLNWTAPLFLTLLPALASRFVAWDRCRPRRKWLRSWTPGLRLTTFVCLAVNLGLLGYLLLVQPRTHALTPFGPWRELAAVVESHEEALEDFTGREPLVIADGKYRLASVLAFYRTPLEVKVPASQWTTSQWVTSGSGLGYEYWSSRSDWTGRDCIYLTDSEANLSQLSGYFDSVETINEPALKAFPKYQLALCRNLHPPVAGTIR